MHLPDGFVNTGTSVGLWAAALGFLAISFSRVKAGLTSPALQKAFAGIGQNIISFSDRAKNTLKEKKIILMGMMTSLVFAAQMFNFPISSGTSGHLIGGVLAAIICGPFEGVIIISAVLVIQSLLFADGGLLAMGANIINMAVIGSLLSYYIFIGIKRIIKNEAISIFIASWTSVFLASLFCSIEMAVSGTYAFQYVLIAMQKTHAIIGVAEGLITVSLVYILRAMLKNYAEQ